MKHRLDLGALPELGAPEIIEAPLEGAVDRVRGERGLYFRARGGVYGPGPERLFADRRAGAPWPFAGGVGLRWGSVVRFAFDDGEHVDVPGDVFTLASNALVGLVLDRRARVLRRVDLTSREARTIGEVAGGLERQVPGVLSLDPTGTRALVLDADTSGQITMSELNLASGASRIVHGPLPPRSWIVGAFGPHGERVLLEQRFGPTRARLIHQSRTSHVLFELTVAQPMLRPAFLRRDVIAVVLST
ncbi:MAG: hypothetical protein RL846_47585, partial [Deltaproteobacteria bacterium]